MSVLLTLLVALGGIAALVAVAVLIIKLGTIAHLWTKPEPQDESSGHTLAQSREALGQSREAGRSRDTQS